MRVAKVLDRVNTTLNEGCDVEEAVVIDLINEMLQDLHGERNFPLPGSEVRKTLSCSGTSVLMPTDFSQNLFFAAVEGRTVSVCSSMRLLLRRYPTAGGSPPNDRIYVCVNQNRLEVRPSFTGDIEIHYYKKPKEVSTVSDELPFGREVPDSLQMRLAHAYCCKELFSDIEDGMEGQPLNTLRHEQRYEVAVNKLRLKLGHGQSRPEPIRDEFTYQRI